MLMTHIRLPKIPGLREIGCFNAPPVSAFTPIPLGQPIPASPHAVSCSLPTLRAVRGYEEKDPEVLRAMSSGYPRFVVHPYSRKLAQHLGGTPGLAGRTLWLTSSDRMAAELAAHLGGEAFAFTRAGVSGVAHLESSETAARAKLFLQNIGGFISSREAEDQLVRLGVRGAPQPETYYKGDGVSEVRRHLRRAFPGAGDEDILLANSGMNAIYAAFRSISDLQAARGRTIWVQLGWLYLDTIAVLKKYTSTPADYLYASDVLDRAALERIFAERGRRIAGVLTEIPTNPLIQTPDVAWLSRLCRSHGASLVLDPSASSPFSVDVLAYADLVASSLTKYAASEGDVIAGVVAINRAGGDAAALRQRLPDYLEPVYARDTSRLAAQIGQVDKVLARIEANVPRVAEFLASHPKVKEVCWALQPNSIENYRRVARGPQATGGMITFTLRVPMEPFYDRLELAKGPSFGMKTTLICPFMYLAHYDLVTTPAGRAELAASGVEPDLLRLCVGTESAEDIIAALAEALQ
jgi:cystathionine gamma-synthase